LRKKSGPKQSRNLVRQLRFAGLDLIRGMSERRGGVAVLAHAVVGSGPGL
jgi:hypothetical protein